MTEFEREEQAAALERVELRQYYADRREMLASPGWNVLMDELRNARAAYADLSGLTSTESLWFAKGRVDQIDYLLGLEASTDAAADLLTKEGRI